MDHVQNTISTKQPMEQDLKYYKLSLSWEVGGCERHKQWKRARNHGSRKPDSYPHALLLQQASPSRGRQGFLHISRAITTAPVGPRLCALHMCFPSSIWDSPRGQIGRYPPRVTGAYPHRSCTCFLHGRGRGPRPCLQVRIPARLLFEDEASCPPPPSSKELCGFSSLCYPYA